jgi:CheY-like chemotaxis protein
MLDGGTLRVAACNERVLGDGALPPGDYVRIEVSDTGIGMPAEVAAKAFDPLAQGDDGGVARVGLANVRSTVVRHKGRVELKSAVGQGTTVSLLLPAGPSSAEDRERTAQERRAIGKGRKLLVVDDEPANRTSLARLLTLRGYEVLLADDGASAIRIAGEQGGRIDLVLLDLLMPEMNGKEVLEALRASHPSLKVLLVTGYSEHAMVQEAIEIGVAAVAYKPFDVPALLGQVQQLTAPAREATAGGAS